MIWAKTVCNPSISFVLSAHRITPESELYGPMYYCMWITAGLLLCRPIFWL